MASPSARAPLSRRQFATMVGAAAGAGLLSACSKSYAGQGSGSSSPSAGPAPNAEDSEWKTLRFESSTDQPDGQVAQVLVPPESSSLGTLIALHGRGESTRGLDAGAGGWRKDYELGVIHHALLRGPITREDVKGFLSDRRLDTINSSLRNHPYKGLNVACPYSPNLGKPSEDEAQPFARFLIDVLLPRVSELTGAPRSRERTGIDGVSMGGRLALLTGLSHPDVFSSVGALQPQIEVREAEMLANLAARANAKQKIALRLVSSDDDPFLDSVQALSAALEKVGVEYRTIITQGPHDYIWNKGPGGCEMLMFHERVLRSLDPP